MAANQAELQELEATEQHLKRQQASLTERLSRLENQSVLKREAAASAVEEQLKEKEAIEAENAAARAKIAENEATVSCLQAFVWLQHMPSGHFICVTSHLTGHGIPSLPLYDYIMMSHDQL